jgi:hypothetical protein
MLESKCGGKQIYLSNHQKDLKCFCDETELSTRIDVVPTVQIRFLPLQFTISQAS